MYGEHAEIAVWNGTGTVNGAGAYSFQFTVVDGYALVFYGWGVRGGFPMNELGAYTAWKDRMLKRPAVRKILDSEQNVLVKPA